MGITGLLPYLAQATRQCHISEFRNGTVAVDSYCLLHKGTNACAEQLARGEDNQMYVDYCLKYVKMLLNFNIHPIMVFDGRNLPAKAETEAKRRDARKKAKQKAAELLKLGKTDEARTYLKQCIDVTPKMAHNLIRACRKLGVDCIVAPYESDAQLAFFNIKNVAECVITEDSDLVLFGCKKVLYKLDLAGAGQLVEAEKIYTAMKMRPDKFTFEKFRFMCILSGCDYVNSLNGIGLKKAEKFLKLTVETNPEVFIDRIPRYLNMRHLVVTEAYKKSVLIANATFLHQTVFDPYNKKLVHLNDPEKTGTNPDYLINAGDKFDEEMAFQVALGNINPYSFEEYDDWDPSEANVSQYSIWAGVCKRRISKKQEKEAQRGRMQEFLQRQAVKMEEIKAREELETIEADERIDKELSLYTKPQILKVEPKEEEVIQEVEKVIKVSPVLKHNPFLKKKTLSKFPKTYMYGTKIMKSRFFPPIVKPESETPSTSEGKVGVLQCLENSSSISPKKKSLVEDKIDINPVSSKKSSSVVDKIDILQCLENSTISPKKKSLVEDKIDILQCLENSSVSTKKRSSENMTENIICIDDEDLVIIENEKPKSPDRKKLKLGPCRTLGLSRKKPAKKPQQTLHKFFDKLKPT